MSEDAKSVASVAVSSEGVGTGETSSSANFLLGAAACLSSQGKMGLGFAVGGSGFDLGMSNHMSLGGSGYDLGARNSSLS